MILKVQSRRPIFSSTLFDIFETKLSINGKIRTHHNIFRHPIVSIFPINDKGGLVLIKQYRYLHDAVFLEEMAGHIDPGEKPLAAAKRELQEEGGITGKHWEEFGSAVGSSSVIKTTIHFFLVRDLTYGKASPEEDEDIKIITMPLAKAVDAVLTGKVQNSIAALGILLLEMKRQKGEL